VIFFARGEVAERLKATVSKTVKPHAGLRGFKSHPLRQLENSSPAAKARDIDEYLAAVPKETRSVLEKLRKTIKAAAPKAEEAISYQIPTFKYHGPLVFFAAFENHCSLYLVSKSLMKTFSGALKPYEPSGTTIHFSADNPLPVPLVKQLVKARMAENEVKHNRRIDNNVQTTARTMYAYVAFLRGINVGGKNIIKMDRLRAEFEKMGFSSVKSYIQSGNVIFQSEMLDKARIEEALATAFKYEVAVLLRSKKEIENTISHFPQIFEDPSWKHNVIFLSHTVDSRNIVNQLAIKNDIEQLSYIPGVLFWSAKLATITKSSMLKLSTKKEFQEMTSRNINTIRRILALMND
jgi:uncharacterized protein (DUF1697 family)/uncharacterized protein YdhG (YjbR/CyaY superfamily)